MVHSLCCRWASCSASRKCKLDANLGPAAGGGTALGYESTLTLPALEGAGVCVVVEPCGILAAGVAASALWYGGLAYGGYKLSQAIANRMKHAAVGYEICTYSGEFEDRAVDSQYKLCTYSCEAGPPAITIPFPVGAGCPATQVRTHK
jgi:hypothetical protein